MRDTATFRRTVAAVCLLVAPVLATLSIALQPPFVQGHIDRLARLDEAGSAAWVSNTAFTVQQPLMLMAFLGIGHLLRRKSPLLSNLGGALGVLATFSEAVMGGIAMVWLTMAGDASNRETLAGVWEQVEGSPVMVFGLVGFLGTVLTIVLLSVGLFRSRIVPRWVPALLWAFLVLETVGAGISEFASFAAGLCLLIAFGTLAAHVWRTPRGDWDLKADIPAPVQAVVG